MRTLYVSRFLFLRTPEGMRALADPYYLHALARGMGGGERSGVGEKGRYLFRIEDTRQGPALLLQTPEHPDFTALPEGALQLVGVKRLPEEAVRPGPYRFFLRANLPSADDPRKPLPLEALPDRLAHLLKGGRLLHLQLKRRPPLRIAPPGKTPFSLDVVEARGVLLVEDPGAVFERLARGVGRGKSYGLGLLSLAPLR